MVVEPQGALTCRLSTLVVFADSGPFWGYCSQFWGHREISRIVDPREVFMCWLSTLIVLADYAPFRELLLTVLGSTSDFHN